MPTNHQHIVHASYSMLAYPAFIAGYRTVEETIQDRLFSDYIRAFWDQYVLSSETDTNVLTNQYLQHFSNSLLTGLCADGASKLATFVLPILCSRLETNGDIHQLAFLIAAYGHYLATSKDEKRVAYDIDEPHLQTNDWAKISDNDVTLFLNISPFASARLHTYPHFVRMYKSYRAQIAQLGIMFLLKQMTYHRPVVRSNP